MIEVVKYEDIKREVMLEELVDLLFAAQRETTPSIEYIAEYLIDHGVTTRDPTVAIKGKYETVPVAACRTLRRRVYEKDRKPFDDFFGKQDIAGIIGQVMLQNGLIKFREIEHHKVSLPCIPYEEEEYKLIGEAKVLREEQ